MITINNNKIAGFIPRWAPFAGFSLLFDSPGKPFTANGPWLNLTGDIDNTPELHLYKALHDGLQSLDPDLLLRSYLFCPLPAPSYHVTLWDGANVGNLALIPPDYHQSVDNLLGDIRHGLLGRDELLELVRASLLVTDEWEIELGFDRLAKWGNVGLVVQLAPTEATRPVFERLVIARSQLSAQVYSRYGIKPNDTFIPHLSLGYFANREAGELTTPLIDGWNTILAERAGGLTVRFQRSSIYGFTDMATFFKVA